MSATRQCRICNAHAGAQAVGLVSNGYPLSRCESCQSVMIERQPQSDELVRVYDRLFANGSYANYRAEFEKLRQGGRPSGFYRAKLLKRVSGSCSGRDLIEIGGGTGSFGVLARQQGWHYTDYDVSGEAVEFARKLGLEAQQFAPGALPPLPPNGADVVAMWEVIEHVWNVHEYLQQIREALRPGGVFLFSTPNYLRPGYRQALENAADDCAPPVHMNFFTSESLGNVLATCGLEHGRVLKPRLYRPQPSLRGLVVCAQRVAHLSEPPSLYGIARKPA